VKIKFCPKCGNEDIVLVAGGNLGQYECKKCKFRGSIFPEKEVEIKNKLSKKINLGKRKNDIS